MSIGTDIRATLTGAGRIILAIRRGRLRAHPAAARILRVLVVVLPVVISAGVVFGVDRSLPAPHGWPSIAAFACLNTLLVLVIVFLVHRLLVRLLPLATLLSLSLVFPDRAPKRFKIALRANSTVQLRTRLLSTGSDETSKSTAFEDLLTYLAALGRHDRMTRGHCERVRAFVDLLAEEMGLSKSDQERLRWAALFHDIGKLHVPVKILRKPGKPTRNEWETLKQHPVDGERLVRPLTPWLGPWALAVEHHHERFGGGGYPLGLVGTEISMGGRIVAVADAYEVMITSRPYKRPVRPEAARQELVRFAGDQFDPAVVRAFLRVNIGDLRKVMGLVGVFSELPLLATVPRAEALLEMAGRQTIGMVGAAAGTGAIAAATMLSPIPSATAVPSSTRPAATAPATPGQVSRGAPIGPAARPAATGGSDTPTEPERSDRSTPGPSAPSTLPVATSGSSHLGTATQSPAAGLGTAAKHAGRVVSTTVESVPTTVAEATGALEPVVSQAEEDVASAIGPDSTGVRSGDVNETTPVTTAVNLVNGVVDPHIADKSGLPPA